MLQFLNTLFEINELDPINELKSAMLAKDSYKAMSILNKSSTIKILTERSIITLYEILKIALKFNQREVVDFLFQPEFLLNEINEGCPALSLCLGYQVDIELNYMLIASGCHDLLGDRASGFVRNLIINTTYNANFEVLELLFQTPEVLASVNEISPFVLDGAFKNKRPEIFERVLMIPEVLNYVRNNPTTVLSDAIRANCPEIVNYLLKLPEVLAVANVSHLNLAIHGGNDKVVTELLKIPSIVANIAANGNHALKCAISCTQDLNVVNQLLQYPAVVQAIDTSVLSYTLQGMDINVLENATQAYRDSVDFQQSEQIEQRKGERFSFYSYFLRVLPLLEQPKRRNYHQQPQTEKLTPDILCRLFAALSPNVSLTLISDDWKLSALYADYKANHRQVVPRIVCIYDTMKKKGLPTDLAMLVLSHTDAVPIWAKQYQNKAIVHGKSKFLQLKDKRSQDTLQAEQFVKEMLEFDSKVESVAPR